MQGKLISVTGHAGELPAASVCAQAAGNHAGAWARRDGWRAHCRLRSGSCRSTAAQIFLLVALAAFLPVTIAMVTHPGALQWLAPFRVRGAAFRGAWRPGRRLDVRSGAAPGAWRGRPRSTAVLVGGVALPVSDMVRLHPYQYTAFNWASGGVRMAHDNYMLDYWGLAFKQAGEALRAKLDAMGLKPPGGRRWIVEICGPQPPAEVALGPEFETTWDRKRADFAMMLGTFYCRDLTAPVLVEINREGIEYARVYDIRGRPVPNLLTEPPP